MPGLPGDPPTEELRAVQVDRERIEREAAAQAPDADEALAHERRADRAAYLRGKLEEQAESLEDADGT